MRYEFSWKSEEDQLKRFGTSCPIIGEVFMRSSTDFPKLTPEIQLTFDVLYGAERGQFEQLLRDGIKQPNTGEIKSQIPELTIRHSEW